MAMASKIVVPLDLNEESSWRKVLPVALDCARHEGARLHLVTVVPDELIRMTIVAQPIPEGFEQRLLDEAQKRLADLVARQVPADMKVEQAVRRGSVWREIVRYARDLDAELVILAAHRPELSDYLLGPIAAQVVRHAACSVWVVRE